MRVTVGFAITLIICSVGFGIIKFRTDLEVAFGLGPNEIGDFLAGIFAPIALTWLIIGYFQQAHELKETRKALEEQSGFLGHQSKTLETQTTLVAKQSDALQRQAFLASYDGRYTEVAAKAQSILRAFWVREKFMENLKWSASGYRDVFCNALKNLYREKGHEHFHERMSAFFTDPNFQIQSLINAFEDFAKDADEVDHSGRIRRQIEVSGLGSAYLAMCKAIGREPSLNFRPKDFAENADTSGGWRQ